MKASASVPQSRRFLSGRPVLFYGPLFALAVLAVFGQGLFHEFVYDDRWTIVTNPALRGADSLLEFFTNSQTVANPAVQMGHFIYRPLPTLTFFLDYRLWGLSPWPWRLENYFLHALNGFLLFQLLQRRLGFSLPAALAGSGLFLWHPVQVESVVWITQRSNLLCLAGLLSSLLFLSARAVSFRDTAAGLACLVLALFSKETAVVFPALLAALNFTVGGADGKRISERLGVYGAVAGLVLLYLLLRQEAGVAMAQRAYRAGGFLGNLLVGAASGMEYAKLMLWPVNLTVSHREWVDDPWRSPAVWAAAASLAAYLAGIAILWRRRGGRVLAFGSAWIFIGLLPVLGLTPIDTFAAERFLYVPLAGAAVLAAALWDRAGKGRTAARAALIAAAVAWAGAAAARTGDWKNDVTLWRSAVRTDPGNLFARACLAEAHQSSGRPDDARREYRAILQDSSPEHLAFAAMNNLARLENQAGRPEEGLRWAEKALSLRPRSPQTLYNAAVSLGLLGRRNEALRAVDRGEEAEPGHARWAELRRKLADGEAGGAP
jgi:protein O-mannosyl-transferase